MTSFLDRKRKTLDAKQEETLTLAEYLHRCKKDPSTYDSAAQRMLKAIGDPILFDSSKASDRLKRVFMNRTVQIYPSFADFYGMEETIERIVNFYRYAAQGLEERKQVLYLLGPVGGGKSSLAERVKLLMEKLPIYVLADENGNMSPLFESPLELFGDEDKEGLNQEFNIPPHLITGFLSPWGVKRLGEYNNDVNRFTVKKVWPSKLKQIGIMKVEPGDENNQDVSTMIGKADIRKLEKFSQNDADAYSYSGGLNRTSQGLLEFVEMFKAPIKMLHPLLTATQEGNYIGTEAIGAMPYRGTIVAHSNEAEWITFRNNKDNEAFIDRIYLIQVPYCLRVTEEAAIYKKLISVSELAKAPCAPDTVEMLARFTILSKLERKGASNLAQLLSKMRIYDGETLKDVDPNAKSLQDYKDSAGVREGMAGVASTRFAFKVLSETFNHDATEIAADPVHLMYVLENTIRRAQFPEQTENDLLDIIKSVLAPKYAEYIGEEIQKAYIESYDDYGQNVFDRYVAWADAWIEEIEYKDSDTGQTWNRSTLETELAKIEKPAGVVNVKDFRNEVVKFALRAKAANAGNNPKWTSYEKIREVIEKRMFGQIEELLPVISFGSKKDGEIAKKHHEFVTRLETKGYTQKQIRRLVEWYIRVKSSS